MRFDHLERRKFIMLVGGAVLGRPFVARAQQRAVPVIGVLGSDPPQFYADRLRAFRQGLKERGYLEGENFAIDYRWPADGMNDQLPPLAADLARRQVSVIVALGSTPAALAAKSATTTIPVVFFIGADPVQLGLVASMSKPGGNLTGATTLNQELAAKRVELLHLAVPATTSMVLLVNPTTPNLAAAATKDAYAAAQDLGIKLDVLRASTEGDFDIVFATLTQLRAGGLVIATDAFFISQSEQLAALALRHRVPAIFLYRPFVAAGGLMSYGTPIEMYSLAGVYTARILKGERPADLPVQQITKVELLINLKTAKALGLEIPPSLLARADEMIE
jgi:putative ABC transport system substrate-binding protein